MSWIQENKFIAGLGGATLIGAIVLLYIGSKGGAAYEEAKMEFDTTMDEVSGFERLSLYPKQENLDGKRKALSDYREAVEELQKKFDTFRTGDLENISPQEFTTRLRAANDEVRKAFEEAGATVPGDFFLGFESYTTALAQGSATGILNYQLAAVKEIMLQLASAAPTELKNLHRPRLPEESGQAFTADPLAVARSLPLEITFKGTEKSVREFMSALSQVDTRYVVVRSLRISNEKKTPPKSSDATFEQPAAGGAAFGGAAGGAFADFFSEVDEEPEDGDAGDSETPSAAPSAPADSSRILVQVLGEEELTVFLRLDLLQFLPVKELPQL